MVLSEEEVKRSFAKVREDILQVKRSLNKQLFATEEISKTLGNSLGKQEFYAFIQRLGPRIEEIEGSFAAKSDTEDVEEVAAEMRGHINALAKVVKQRDDIADEIRQARALKGKVLELEGVAVGKSDFAKETSKLRSELAAVKSSLASKADDASSLKSTAATLATSLADLSAKLNTLQSKAVVKNDISAFTDRIENSHQEVLRGFSSLKRDVDRKTARLSSVDEQLSSLLEKIAAAEAGLAAANERASKKLVDKSSFDKAVRELGDKLAETRQLLESSMSEASLDDYATKRSVKQQVSGLSDSIASSLKDHVDSLRDDIEKQIQAARSSTASSKELKKLREELESAAGKLSGLVSSEEVDARLRRVEESAGSAASEYKKELKKQRELFEERLKSLESHYKSSHDIVKDEIGELRGQVKSLSKADEQAKTEMAKITVSAAKAAAKSAADILEEVEKESPERPRKNGRKGIPPLLLSLIVLALLVTGSVAYVVLMQDREQPSPVVPTENETTPPIIIPTTPMKLPVVIVNETLQTASPAASPEVQPESNITPPIPNPTAPLTPAQQDEECKQQLECTEREGQQQFDCYFDRLNQECRCFVGVGPNCPPLEAAVEENESAHTEEEQAGGKAGLRYYGIVAFILAVVAFLAYRALFVKDEKEAHKPKEESKSEKPGNRKAKPEEEAEGDDATIDLEEFFEKKDKKK